MKLLLCMQRTTALKKQQSENIKIRAGHWSGQSPSIRDLDVVMLG